MNSMRLTYNIVNPKKNIIVPKKIKLLHIISKNKRQRKQKNKKMK